MLWIKEISDDLCILVVRHVMTLLPVSMWVQEQSVLVECESLAFIRSQQCLVKQCLLDPKYGRLILGT